jgi:AcrR family transcriptional regulator
MKDQIIQTSLARFLKYGVRKMTLQKLVSPLGISTKTVYKYFRDKENLLKECLIFHYDALVKTAISRDQQFPNPVIALERSWSLAIQADFGVNSVFYHDINYYYPALQDEILKSHEKKISTVFTKIIKEGIKKNYFRSDVLPAVIYEGFMVIYRSLTRSNHFKQFHLPPDVLASQTILIYLRGICTEKGLRELESINK